jgi:DNA-binding transcriptional MocR family regulator
MLPVAVNELLAYTTGNSFYGDGRGANNIRVCFSHPTAENVKVGIKRLSNVVNLQLDLLDTFGARD